MIVQAFLLLVGSVLSFLITLCLVRFLMQSCRVSFAGQFGNFVVQITNWLIKPLRRIIPGLWGQDMASLVAAYLLQLVSTAINVSTLSSTMFETMPMSSVVTLVFWSALMGLLRLVVYLFIAAVIAQAVLSWVNPFSPLARPLAQFTDPVLRPFRRMLPPIAGVDLSPLAVLLLAQVVLLFL